MDQSWEYIKIAPQTHDVEFGIEAALFEVALGIPLPPRCDQRSFTRERIGR